MKLYLDMNVYNRIFDDQNQIRFIRTINANINNITGMIGALKIMNPIDFLREEMNINVVE